MPMERALQGFVSVWRRQILVQRHQAAVGAADLAFLAG
jgi:hypothetical protein